MPGNSISCVWSTVAATPAKAARGWDYLRREGFFGRPNGFSIRRRRFFGPLRTPDSAKAVPWRPSLNSILILTEIRRHSTCLRRHLKRSPIPSKAFSFWGAFIPSGWDAKSHSPKRGSFTSGHSMKSKELLQACLWPPSNWGTSKWKNSMPKFRKPGISGQPWNIIKPHSNSRNTPGPPIWANSTGQGSREQSLTRRRVFQFLSKGLTRD